MQKILEIFVKDEPMTFEGNTCEPSTSYQADTTVGGKDGKVWCVRASRPDVLKFESDMAAKGFVKEVFNIGNGRRGYRYVKDSWHLTEGAKRLGMLSAILTTAIEVIR